MIYYRKTLFGSGPKLTAVQQHGFNSGMLAGTRFVLDALDAGIEEAYEIFPDLNS